MIAIIQDPDIDTFLNHASPLLYAQEDEYGLVLGLSENLKKNILKPQTPPVFLRVVNNGVTTAVALQTPPMPLLLSHIRPEELKELVNYLKKTSLVIPGVMATTKVVDQFRALWGKDIKERVDQRLYRLDKVFNPGGTGKLILADTSLEALLAQWYRDFSVECMPSNEHKTPLVAREHMERYVLHQAAYALMDGDVVVSMAISHRSTKNGASIGYVYTPPEFRKKGYASQTVALLSQRLLDSGKTFCVLYTDLSNPTSNKIYQDIGYREVSDSLLVLFSDVNSSTP